MIETVFAKDVAVGDLLVNRLVKEFGDGAVDLVLMSDHRSGFLVLRHTQGRFEVVRWGSCPSDMLVKVIRA